MKRLVLLSALALAACPAPTTVDNNGPDMSACEPPSAEALCEAAGVECSMAEVLDPCLGMLRAVNCGECAYQETCTQDRVCVCVPEDDAAFCHVRPEGECGTLMKPDNCGTLRPIAECGCNAYNICVENDCTGDMADVRLKPDEDPRTHHYGFDVSIRNDALIVGAPIRNLEDQDIHRGYALAYDLRINGRWAEAARFEAPTGMLQPTFGQTVATDGEQAFVASPGNNEVHVWRRDAADWTFHGTLTSPDVGPGAEFGAALVIGEQGDVYVGAPGRNEGRGAIVRFVWSGEAYEQEGVIQASAPSRGERFGHAFVIRGDKMAVGAPAWKKLGMARKGRVHLFARPVMVWEAGAVLEGPSQQLEEGFGWSLAWKDDRMVVGAPFYSDPYESSGRVYVFETAAGADPASWPDVKVWQHTGQRPNDFLGWQVAVQGERVVATIPNVNLFGLDSGIILFLRPGEDGEWEEDLRKHPEPRAAFENFGYAISHDERQLIVGTRPYQRVDELENEGATPQLGRVSLGSAVYQYSLPKYFDEP